MWQTWLKWLHGYLSWVYRYRSEYHLSWPGDWDCQTEPPHPVWQSMISPGHSTPRSTNTLRSWTGGWWLHQNSQIGCYSSMAPTSLSWLGSIKMEGVPHLSNDTSSTAGSGRTVPSPYGCKCYGPYNWLHQYLMLTTSRLLRFWCQSSETFSLIHRVGISHR